MRGYKVAYFRLKIFSFVCELELWSLGLPLPSSYKGRIVSEAFHKASEPASAAI